MSRYSETESLEPLANQPEYSLGESLLKGITNQQTALENLGDTSVSIPTVAYDNLRAIALSLRQVVTSTEPSISSPSRKQVQKLNGPGWEKTITLGKVEASMDIAGTIRFTQRLISKLTTGGIVYTLAVDFKDREGYTILIPDTIGVSIKKPQVVEASTTLPTARRRANPMQTVLDVSAYLEDYPSSKSVRPRQTVLTIRRPNLHVHYTPHLASPIGQLTFDPSGKIKRNN